MGGIKIHRTNCPNAPQMISRFGYRIIKARWSGKSEGSQYPITLRVVGHDDIGIVTNITSIISKEKEVMLRSISIDTNAGLFQGNLTVMVNDNKSLDDLIKKVKNVKGVKNVSRTWFLKNLQKKNENAGSEERNQINNIFPVTANNER